MNNNGLPEQKVVLLAGYARAGKDTVARYMKNRYLYRPMKFAGPLYDMVIAMYHQIVHEVSPAYIEARKQEVAPGTTLTWRELMQTLGTEWGRDMLGADIWCNLAAETAYAYRPQNIVFSDARFFSEYERLQQDERFDVRLLYIARDDNAPQMAHRSEQEIGQLRRLADFEIENNSDIPALYEQVDIALDSL